ncbi:acyl-ACP--UDP-N-acetylglucosamine O-acyltransferase [Deferribacter abyssi]|uniref:acyl-ACP--UDP-N-acetylglucosamine O-acyltransferase n=1 Tax=Deferribacter abyssi TaxID=213806 RepID=UPI003C18E29D
MIHKSAIIDKTVEIGQNVEIGPNVYIGKNCIIHDGVKIGAGAVIEENTEILDNTVISPNAHLGGPPQDISYKGEDTKLKIGKNCVIREFTTIHRASTKEDWVTEIGNNCYIMASSHIAHDCKFGDSIILTSYSGISGHVHVDDFAVISGFVAVHQFVRVGKLAMIGGMSRITKDVPPFTLVEGNPAVIHGLNVVGLRRRNIHPEVRSELKKLLKIYLNRSLKKDEAISEMKLIANSQEGIEFVDFFESSKRGVVRR